MTDDTKASPHTQLILITSNHGFLALDLMDISQIRLTVTTRSDTNLVLQDRKGIDHYIRTEGLQPSLESILKAWVSARHGSAFAPETWLEEFIRPLEGKKFV